MGTWAMPLKNFEYKVKDFKRFFNAFLKTGVFANSGLQGSTAFQVTATNPNSMNVNVGIGEAFVEGGIFLSDTTRTFSISPANATQDRIDSIAICWNYGGNMADIIYKENNATAVRNENVYELIVATINVPRNASSIQQWNINDTRMNSAFCGYATPHERLNTGDLFAQFNSAKDKHTQEFFDWFNNLKNMLNTNQASNLQNQIDKLNAEGQPGRFRVYDDLNTVPTGLDVFWKEYPLKNTPADMQGGGLVQTFKKDKEAFQIAIGFDVDKSPSFRWKWLEKWTAWQSFVSTDENDIVKVKKLKADQLEVTSYKIISNFQLGYGRTGTLMRVGNMVFLNSQGQYLYAKTNANNQWLTINEKIPVGYRPIVGLQATSFSLGNPDKRTHNDIATNGDMRLHTGTGWGEDEWFIMPQVSWATNDPFPE